MKIVSLKLKNYRLFESLEITDIPPFCVFIGANGTGKSTLFDIFGFLRDALKNNIRLCEACYGQLPCHKIEWQFKSVWRCEKCSSSFDINFV